MAAYLPAYRIKRSAMTASGDRGTRTVASYDEDTTTLGVEAGRLALHGRRTEDIERLLFATTAPAYADKNNASTVHAALGLAPEVTAVDTGGALRSGVGALLTALHSGPRTLVITADMRNGRPGSDDERSGGDAAAAIAVGEDGVIADFLGSASATMEIMDRWRPAGETTARSWEERFGEAAYLEVADKVVSTALTKAGVRGAPVEFLVSGAHFRAVAAVRKMFAERATADLSAETGHCGTAHGALLLISALEQAEPGQIFALVSLADGVDVLVFRATDSLAGSRPALSLRAQLDSPGYEVDYHRFLTWRGHLVREAPRRPEPARPSAPPTFRNRDWKFGLAMPDNENSRRGLSGVHGTIATHTTDHLTPSPSPPTVVAVVDLDGGGRRVTELTDVRPEAVAVGGRVEMTFRRLYTADGIHNYFWKARPERLVTEP